MKRSIYAVACLMMVLLAGFTACGDDDDSSVAYFEKNRDYIREKKAFYQRPEFPEGDDDDAYSCQCCARIRSNIAE